MCVCPGGGERGGVGVVPLPPDLLAAAVADSVVALLAPNLLAVSLSLAPASPEGAPFSQAGHEPLPSVPCFGARLS